MAEPVLAQPASLAAGLAAALHRAGLPVTPERAGRFARSMVLLPPDTRDRLYWTARVALVSARSEVAVFDAVFAAVFDGILDPADNRGDTAGPPPVGSEPRRAAADARPSVDNPSGPTADPGFGGSALGGSADAAGSEREAVLAAASARERLGQTSFADLADADVAEMRRLIRKIELATPSRRTRRTRVSRRAEDRLDLRRTLRRAHRSAGDPVRPVHRRRRARARRLVLLCDVSGSMEPYTRVYLTLLQGAVAGVRAEAFVFSTRLTRLTRQLALRDPDQALAAAAAAAPDMAGGTRLAASLQRFLDDYGRRGLARGAVVLILSDGWEQDDPERVGEQMARLHRLAHRVVWVNPRKSARGYAPLVGGMAAALPYCDAFVSGHSLDALAEVAAAIAG